MTTKQIKPHYARVHSHKQPTLKMETTLDPSIFDSIYTKGYGVPRVFPYVKLTIEACVEMCIQEFNEVQQLLDEQLKHVFKGLLAALDFATSCDSWTNHAFIQKDLHRYRKILKQTLDYQATLEEPKHNPLRRTFTPVVFTLENDVILGHFQKEVDYQYNAVVAFPISEDRRERFAYAVRMLTDMTIALKPSKRWGSTEKYNYFEGQTDEEVHEEWIYAVSKAARSISYLINSTSWKSNKMASFDLMEMTMKTRV